MDLKKIDERDRLENIGLTNSDNKMIYFQKSEPTDDELRQLEHYERNAKALLDLPF